MLYSWEKDAMFLGRGEGLVSRVLSLKQGIVSLLASQTGCLFGAESLTHSLLEILPKNVF